MKNNILTGFFILSAYFLQAQRIIVNAQPSRLAIRMAGENSIRVTLKPLAIEEDALVMPMLSAHKYPAPAINISEISHPIKTKIGNLLVEVHNDPLVIDKGATSREVYLPEGKWYDWWTNIATTGGKTIKREVDLETMPIYVRAGAIIPFDPVRQYTGEIIMEPTTSGSTVVKTGSLHYTRAMALVSIIAKASHLDQYKME